MMAALFSSIGMAPCDLLEACQHPSSCPVFSESPPPIFDTVMSTTAGTFTIRTYTEWAPPYATRFWQLGRLQYMNGAPFYRVDRKNSSVGWVVQFGYSGQPSVDQCWDELQTLNTTWSVKPPGNVQGAVSFSMDAVKPSTAYPNCTSADYCARGFSTNIFINYQNNSGRLDPPAFSPFGVVLPPGMDVVNKLYAGYGEVRSSLRASKRCRHRAHSNLFAIARSAAPSPQPHRSPSSARRPHRLRPPRLVGQTFSAPGVAPNARASRCRGWSRRATLMWPRRSRFSTRFARCR